ncbi:wax ester/triacylglycerol synthase domain-containing protein [Microbacterium sp. NPDC077184]|uniref:wax ester/triacylglycerol synthase domain-containing protein n=1 Tax=Microbacterium sp. NPDC077184 TaxID=3154764 RepID=UPI00343CB87A
MARSSVPVDLEVMRILDETHAWTSIAYQAAHTGGALILDGASLLDGDGALDPARIFEVVERRIAAVPDLRKKMVRSPLGLTAPVWVPDADFDVRRHVLIRDEILELSPRTLAHIVGTDGAPLPQDRPVWDVTFTRLTTGEVAMGMRLHHVMGDAKWAFETLTLWASDSAASSAAEGASIQTLGRPPRTRALIPVLVAREWLREQPSFRAGWHEYWRKPFDRRVRRMLGRNVRPIKEWLIRRRGLTARHLPPGRVSFVEIPMAEATAAASTHGGSITELLVAAAMRAVDDDDRGLDVALPVSRREKGDRTVRNHVSMLRVHGEPGVPVTELVSAVRKQIRRYVARIEADPQPVGRTIGYATYVPWVEDERFLLGAQLRRFIVIPAVDARDELNLFALSYDGTLYITAKGRAELDIDGAVARVRDTLRGEVTAAVSG